MLTEKGFHRPTYDEILAGRISRAKQLFGADVDTGETGLLGKLLRIGAYDFAQAYEDLEGAYLARFPNSAAGQSLDRLMPFAGTRRDPASAAIRQVRLRGTAGHTAPVGLRLADENGQTFHTLSPVTLGADGSGEVLTECDAPGKGGNGGSLVELVNPSADISTAEDLGLVIAGREAESDYDLRLRFQKTVAGAGSATVDAIEAQIMRVAGVQSCFIEENEGDVNDGQGRPPHSFEAYVLAPPSVDLQVATAIFEKKPLGIRSVGGVAVAVADLGGRIHTVRFSRTEEVALRVRCSIRVSVLFESNGTDEIAENLVRRMAGLKNGEDVILSTLYGNIHSVPGVVETSKLELSTDGIRWAAANVAVGAHQVARLKAKDVAVEVSKDAGE